MSANNCAQAMMAAVVAPPVPVEYFPVIVFIEMLIKGENS
jgi:hypothetical protein